MKFFYKEKRGFVPRLRHYHHIAEDVDRRKPLCAPSVNDSWQVVDQIPENGFLCGRCRHLAALYGMAIGAQTGRFYKSIY